jgi:parallel beta-helix repeat protein
MEPKLFEFLGGEQSLAPTPPCTITVNPGSSIQEAIENASKGAVVCLAEGAWDENIVIKKSLILRGAGPDKSVIKGVKENEPVILIKSGSVTIESLTIAEAKTSMYYTDNRRRRPAGLMLTGKAQATIRNATFSNNPGIGIVIGRSAQAAIENSKITGNLEYGILMRGSSQATISHTTISQEAVGIMMRNSSQATIKNSTVRGSISITDSSQATVENSIIKHPSFSVFIAGSSKVMIRNTEIGGELGIGIMIMESSQAEIENSKISYNLDGVLISDSSQVMIKNNKIFKNRRYGIALSQSKSFTGAVRGSKNEIHDNAEGDVCPSDLQFLMTPAGGCYGPQCP